VATRPSERDYLAVLEVARQVAETRTPDQFGPTVLRELAGLVRSDVTSLNEVDPEAGRFVYIAEPADYPFPAGAEAAFAELAHQHPLIRRYAETGDGSAAKISDVWSVETWHDSEIFRRFYGRLGVEYQMAIALPAPRPIVIGIALNRHEDDFSERDRAVLNLVRPHLAQAWRRAREYERFDALVATAAGVLADSGTGVIVLDEPDHELTPGTYARLYRYFGAPSAHDALPARVRRWLAAQQAVPPGGPELSRPLRATFGGRQLVVRFLPAATGRRGAVLVDEHVVEQSTAVLVGVGLTDREATVLELASGGATNAEIAAQLSLSPWTVKRHLANIYAKLGVNGRVRASAVAIELAAHHRANGSSST
jgi:DNA-binding CsgD family transcriptional regulator